MHARKLSLLLVILLLLLFGACASEEQFLALTQNSPKESTTPSGQNFQRTELFFGLSIQKGDGEIISEIEWQTFLDAHITPRFPDGLTVVNISGQWKHGAAIIKEKGKLLILLHPESTETNNYIEEIRELYKKEFHQNSVIRVTSPVLVSF